MKRRVEVYPNIRMAKINMDEYVLKNDITYYNRATLELTKDNVHHMFISSVDKLRGYMYDEMYIHPNVKKNDRLRYIIEAISRGAKIVFKE